MIIESKPKPLALSLHIKSNLNQTKPLENKTMQTEELGSNSPESKRRYCKKAAKKHNSTIHK